MKQILQVLKSRTIQFSIALAVLSLLQGYIGFLPVSPAGQAIVGSVLAGCVVVLRAVTTTSLITKT
jgi:hypothetical protein